MIELYIDGKRADIKQDSDIKITYQSADVKEPTAIKNSFSKSLNLDGTPVNNSIFGHCYRLDINILESDSLNGVNFDPRKRVPFDLINNGEIIESGYIKLNTVSVDGGKVKYNITLYGSLGDFFYNLAYNEDGEQLTLADIYFGFDDAQGKRLTESEETKDRNIIKWDAHFIKDGWKKLKTGAPDNHSPSNFVVGAPAYSGYYDDFNNDKFLVNYKTLTDSEKRLFPDVDNGYDGYVTVTAQREFDEWEARDLRSVYQRPCIKTDFLIDAICKSQEKNGYTVELSDSIRNSKYFNRTWVMLSRLDRENSTQSGIYNLTLDFDTTPLNSRFTNIPLKQGNDYAITVNQNETVSFNLLINNIIQFPTRVESGKSVATSFLISNKKSYYFHTNFGGYLYGIVLSDEQGKVVHISPMYLHTTKLNNKYNYLSSDIYGNWAVDPVAQFGVFKNKLITDIKKDLGTTDDLTLKVIYSDLEETDDATGGAVRFKFKSDMRVKTNYYNATETKLRARLYFRRISYAVLNNSVYDISGNETFGVDVDGNGYYWLHSIGGLNKLIMSVNSGFFYGEINPDTSVSMVSKQMLFGNLPTPLDFLTDYFKLFNSRFIFDPKTKTVRIMTAKEYYKDSIVDIDADIDRSKTITITPTVIDNKYFLYGMPVAETYAERLYSNKNNVPYGYYRLVTPYNFSNSEKDIFSDSIYTNTIPYRLNSQMFGRTKIDENTYYPTFAIPYTYSYNYMDNDFTHNGAMASVVIPRYTDEIPKLCCFDTDNSQADIPVSLVFFDGFKHSSTPIIVSDTIDEMIDTNENPCYLYDNALEKVYDIPVFSKYLTGDIDYGREGYTHSLDFGRPTATFLGDLDYYTDDTQTLSEYWRTYIDDIYAKNAKTVKLKARIKGRPLDAMRVFYAFDNCLWLLLRLDNYNPNDTLSDATFVKIDSIDNYI